VIPNVAKIGFPGGVRFTIPPGGNVDLASQIIVGIEEFLFVGPLTNAIVAFGSGDTDAGWQYLQETAISGAALGAAEGLGYVLNRVGPATARVASRASRSVLSMASRGIDALNRGRRLLTEALVAGQRAAIRGAQRVRAIWRALLRRGARQTVPVARQISPYVGKSAAEISKIIGPQQRRLLKEFFGTSLKGAQYRAANFGVPKGLNRRTLEAYEELARRAINAGADATGTQAVRLELVQRAYEVVR
jgi:hypothetical protein